MQPRVNLSFSTNPLLFFLLLLFENLSWLWLVCSTMDVLANTFVRSRRCYEFACENWNKFARQMHLQTENNGGRSSRESNQIWTGVGGRSWSFNAYCPLIKANLTYVCVCVCVYLISSRKSQDTDQRGDSLQHVFTLPTCLRLSPFGSAR